jgi:N-acetylglutamate synthase-like GNAT family acetyltransferase
MRESTAVDLPAIRSLLTEAGLPAADLDSSPGLRLWVAEDRGALVGVIGLEQFRSAGLLRSLVVAPHHRQRGLGRRLVDTVERQAKAADLKQLALLTETADRFFEALGYRLVDRQSVPEDVRQSAEFRTLCPLSAQCMAKIIA